MIWGHLARGRLQADGGVRDGQHHALADGIDPRLVLRHPLRDLRGPFALALWDGATLLLARDAFGQRPLFYAERGGELWFASSPSELKARGADPGPISREALSDFLELGYVPAPGSIFSGFRKLPAGHFLRAGEHGVEVRRWFEPPAPGSSEKKPSRISVRARLEDAVRLADSAACTLLTGDLASSALLALMTRRHGRVPSVGEPEPLARRMAERFRSAHVEAAANALAQVPDALAGLAEPLGDPRFVELAALLVASGARSAVSAAGADELFAGHARYLRAARMPRAHRVAKAAGLVSAIAPRVHRGRLQRAASALGTSGAARARALVEVFSLEEREALLGTHARVAEGASVPAEGDADAAIAFDLEVALPDGWLSALNAAAARAGAEVAAPMLDPALAALVVPPAARHKLGPAHGGRLLRDAIADLLPRDVLAAPEPPPPPVGAWLRGPLRPHLHDLVAPPSARIRTLLHPRAVDDILRHALLPRGDAQKAWTLLVLELWVRSQRR